MSVKRYNLSGEYTEWGMAEASDGEFVRFEDYEKLRTNLLSLAKLLLSNDKAGVVQWAQGTKLACHAHGDFDLTVDVETISRLQAENESLQQDAARYRYIRQREPDLSPEREENLASCWNKIMQKGCWAEDMDKAIDAAMAREGK